MTQKSWLDKYNEANEWHDKCLIMTLYHQTMRLQMANCWSMKDTAEYFGVSIGLVSENIKLSNAIDEDVRLTKCKTRQQALNMIKK
jgi:hypothetical protein